MDKAQATIRDVAAETDRVILFHSASGKDSIAMLDLIAPHFREIICVYMFVVSGLAHIGRYISWATERYANARFVQVPHYAAYSYRRDGFMGCSPQPDTRLRSLTWITDKVRERMEIEWVFFGFKQNDSMNRRVMLRSYGDLPVCREGHKAFPLSEWSNADVMAYVRNRGLITPEWYGGDKWKSQSSGTDISNPEYLSYLKNQFPGDYAKVLSEYPMADRILFEYEYGKDKTE